MSNTPHNEVEETAADIHNRMLGIAKRCIVRRVANHTHLAEAAAMSKAMGDQAFKRGQKVIAAKHHQKCLQLLADAAGVVAEIIELCEDWKLPLPECIGDDDRWQLAGCDCEKSTSHKGVGEGYDGLPTEPFRPDSELDGLEFGALSDEEIKHIDHGLQVSFYGRLWRHPDHQFHGLFQTEAGQSFRIPPDCTVKTLWRHAMNEAENSQGKCVTNEESTSSIDENAGDIETSIPAIPEGV